MQREESQREQRQVPVQSLDEEARPAAAGEPARVQDAEDHAGGQQDQGHQASCPGRVPEERAVQETQLTRGQPPVVTTLPSGLASLAGRFRLCSHCWRRPAADDRRRARRVGVDAGGGRNRDGGPVDLGRPSGARHHDVVQVLVAAAPAADRGAAERGRVPPASTATTGLRPPRRRSGCGPPSAAGPGAGHAVVHADPPAAVRAARACDGDVAAAG